MGKPIIRAIWKRELRSWFGNPTGYVFISLFVFLSAFALVGPVQFFQNNLANLDTLNEWFRILLLFFVPAVTMGIWASERSHGTAELLFTLPATDLQILLGKFFAAVGVYTIALLFTFSLPLGLSLLGRPDFGLILTNYIGYWCLGVTLISVAMVGSQLTDNLTVSFILGALLCAVVVFSEDVVAGLFPDLGRSWSLYGPNGQFEELGRGVVSASALLVFAGLTCAFLYLNLALLSRRHWLRRGEEGTHRSVRFASLVVTAVAVTVFALNHLPRIDGTSEQVHSLSEDTRALLASLDPEKPVYVHAFVSDEVPQEYVQTRRTLLDLLREYDALGKEAVQVRVTPTERFTEAAREAEENFDIRYQTEISEEGARTRDFHIYMGLAFQSGTEEVVIPFLDRKLPVEYEITRSLRVVAQAQRKKVGVLKTDVDLFGGFDFQTMRQNPEWEIISELKLQYEVEPVDSDQDYPQDLDALLVPMASSLTQPQMDRLAAHIEAGGPTLLLDDPFPTSAPGTGPTEPKGGRRNPMMGGPPPEEQKGDIRAMLRELDIRWPYTEITWEKFNPHPELELREPEIVFVAHGSGTSEPFNERERVTSGLQEVVTIFGGHVSEAGVDGLAFSPLLRTGRVSGVIDTQEAFTFNPFTGGGMLNPNRMYRRDVGEKVLACRVTGTPKAAAPENGAAKEGESKEGEAKDKPIHVIFIADLDMMGEVFFDIRKRGFAGTGIEFDNVTFVLNCVDELAGDDSFIELRKRRPRHRTLQTLEAQEQRFNEAWLDEKQQAEQRAAEELAKAQARLDEQVKKVTESSDLDERAKEIQIETIRDIEQRKLDAAKARIEDEKMRAVDAANARRLTQLQHIQQRYTAMTLAGAPIPGILVGIWVWLRRRKRDRAIVPGNRFVRGGA